MNDPLLQWRRDFPILETCTYLISNSLGAMPRSVYDAFRSYADLWATRGVLAWERWVPMVVETGNLVGRIFNAPPGTVMMHQNVSTLTAIVASCLEFKAPRNKVVYTAMNFPTVHYNWKAQEAVGARVEVVPSEDGITVPTERVLAAIDEQTLLVPISHVFFRSAFIQDVKAITEKAHRVGARVLLDSYQAIGTVPTDVQALGVDFLVGGSVKWVCGGPGAGFLYVRPDLIPKLQPRMTGWFSHARPFDFDMEEFKPADGIMRFMGGSPSVPALYQAQCGYQIILKIGVDRIREKSTRQTSRLIALAEEAGLTVNTPRDPARRAGTVSVDCPDSKAVAEELIRRKFIVDYRPKAGVRISPHFYNTDDECDAVIAEIRKIRGSR